MRALDAVEVAGDDHRPVEIFDHRLQGHGLADLAPLFLERPRPGQVDADDVEPAQRRPRHGRDGVQAVRGIRQGGQRPARSDHRSRGPARRIHSH
jgi:hypothetical protein